MATPTVSAAVSSTLVNSLDAVGRPTMARATRSAGDVVKDALVRHYGSLKCAALSLQYDEGQLSRDLKSGDFKVKKLDVDAEVKACVSDALHKAFGVADARAQAQRLIREGRRLLDELADVVMERVG